MMIMQDILTRLQTLETRLQDKGFDSVDVDANINYTAYNAFKVSVRFFAGEKHHNENFKAPTVTDAAVTAVLVEAETYVRDLPSLEEMKKRDFLAEFGKTIDRARELDMPLDFINPLVAQMEKLSTNILEHKPYPTDEPVETPEPDEVNPDDFTWIDFENAERIDEENI